MGKQVGVWVDIDDTITRTDKRAVEILNKKFNKEYTEDDVFEYGFTDLYKGITQQQILELFEIPDFYIDIGTYENSLDVINNRRNEKFYHFNMCTVGTQQNLLNKYNWIMDNILGEINIYGIPLGYNKDKMPMKDCIQIDDNIDMLRNTSAKIKILFKGDRECQRNQLSPNDDFYVVNTWKEIDDILKFYERCGEIV